MKIWFNSLSIKQIIWAALGVLLGLVAANFYFVHRGITGQENYHSVLDVAGKTQMLSQKIALEASKAAHGNPLAKNNLQDALNLHEHYLHMLQSGGQPLGYTSKVKVPAAPPQLQPTVKQAVAHGSVYSQKGQDFITALESGAESASIQVLVTELQTLAAQQLAANQKISAEYSSIISGNYYGFKSGFLLFQLLIIGAFIVHIAGLHKHLLLALSRVVETSENLAQSRLNTKLTVAGRPEMVRLTTSFNQLIERSEAATNFAEAIGRADFSVSLQSTAADRLAQALLSMRDKLKQATDRTEQQRWATEGLSEFEVLMRDTYESTEKLGDTVLAKLVRYLNASQAALFILKEEDTGRQYLEMSSCYALNRKKHLKKRIEIGEGTVGQCVQELDTFYYTDIPAEYPAIKSGLGNAAPTCLLVTPLIYNEEVHGVLELASFKPLAEHEREFITKLTENIASTLGRQLYAGKIEELLKEARMNTEQMHAQEEEMRQHMEEMMATQEEMERKEREYLQMIKELEAAMVTKNQVTETISQSVLQEN